MRALIIRLLTGKSAPKPTLKELMRTTVFPEQLIDLTNPKLYMHTAVERVI